MDDRALDEVLECAVCLERLGADHRILPCQHTLCRTCLDRIAASVARLLCPECRMPVTVPVEQLPRNLLLMRLLDRVAGTATVQQADNGADLARQRRRLDRDLHREQLLLQERNRLEQELLRFREEELVRARRQLLEEQQRWQAEEFEWVRRQQEQDRERQRLEGEHRRQLDADREQLRQDRRTHDQRLEALLAREHEQQLLHLERQAEMERKRELLEQEQGRQEREAARQDQQRKRIAREEGEQRKKRVKSEIEMECVEKFFTGILAGEKEVEEVVDLTESPPSSPTPIIDLVFDDSDDDDQLPSAPAAVVEPLPGCSGLIQDPQPASPPADNSGIKDEAATSPRPATKRRALEELQTTPKLQRVSVMDDSSSPLANSDDENRPPTERTLGMATCTCTAKAAGDLSFEIGDAITLHRRVDSDWFCGEVGGRRGFVAALHCREIGPMPNDPRRCRAIAGSVQPGCAEDSRRTPPLSYSEGDVITVVGGFHGDSFVGTCGDKIGVVSKAHVEFDDAMLVD